MSDPGVERPMRLAAAWVLLIGLGLAGTARAQDAGVADDAAVDPELEAFRRMVDADPFTDQESDPIGTSAGDAELRTMSLPEPDEIVEERIPPQSGEILTAIPGVRAVEHRADVELREGLAIVRERVRFASSARVPAEVRYRLAVPAGAALVALEACAGERCRTGLPERATGPLGAYDDAVRATGGAESGPAAHAVLAREGQGEAIVVRAAPVRRASSRDEASLEVRVTWAMRSEVRGGRVRFVVPARGRDVRAAETWWNVRAVDLVAPTIDGAPNEGRAEVRSPSAAVAIAASIPLSAQVRASALAVPCGAGRCVRARVVAGRPSAGEEPVIVAIDASPSTSASARGRIAPAVRTLLSSLPAGTPVRVVAFAARAEEVTSGPVPPTGVGSDALDLAVERELGSATRFEALWALVEPWARRGTRIVIVGDGGLTASDAADAALDAAARAGVRVASVSVADRASTAALRRALARASGLVVDAGVEAERASAARDLEPLVARLSSVIAPVAVRAVSLRIGGERRELGVLREGEEIVWEGPVAGAMPVSIVLDGATTRATNASADLAPALVALSGGEAFALAAVDASDVARAGAGSCRARGPYASNSGTVARGERLALAHTRRCDPPARPAAPATERRSGIPARVLLQSLRRRVIPPARACFRADRAGRASYQERAEIRVELADREIAASHVGGAIQESLRACLEDALDRLDVPGFEGRVIVTWPLYTAPTMPPPVLELQPEVADEVDRVVPGE